MFYQKVGDRCAFTLTIPGLDASANTILSVLKQKGFEIVAVNIIEQARTLIGHSRYYRAVRMSTAPKVVDCASLVKWLYGERGVWLPRNFLRWQEFGVSVREPIGGDLIFTTGRRGSRVGHVGIASGPDTMIHAINRMGVQEVRFDILTKSRRICMYRRLFPKDTETVTLRVPVGEELETSDEIEWRVRDALQRQSIP